MESTVVAPVQVERWPTEIPLLVLAALASAAIWLLAIVTIVPILYAALLGLFFFVGHLAFTAQVRGSAVRVGPDQLPELHRRVERIADTFGLKKMPEVYVMQAGGALNALAMRLFRANIVVLFSDLLDACGEDDAARDMIIGHELGHVRAGHLLWLWALLPAWLVPFLGTALSRAREYTCDRYGVVAAGNSGSAVLGLTILAAGASHARRIDPVVFLRQRQTLNTGWMVLGQWLATHPPLVKRIAAIWPSSDIEGVDPARGYARAIGILAAFCLPMLVASVVAMVKLPGWLASLKPPVQQTVRRLPQPPPDGLRQCEDGLKHLGGVVEGWREAGQEIPWDGEDLHARWVNSRGSEPEPRDPFDGEGFGYDQRGTSFRLWSVGPDQESWTADDLIYDSRTRTVGRRGPDSSAK